MLIITKRCHRSQKLKIYYRDYCLPCDHCALVKFVTKNGCKWKILKFLHILWKSRYFSSIFTHKMIEMWHKMKIFRLAKNITITFHIFVKKKKFTFRVILKNSRAAVRSIFSGTRHRTNLCRTPLKRQQNSRFNGGRHVFLRQIV